jgi:hypothetical protein
MNTAPVALFVYNRADNMLKTLECLVLNTLAAETDLYVFSDGGKDTKSWKQVEMVRRELRRFKTRAEQEGALKSMTIIERPVNFYLERNITEGIAQVFEKHDRIIVLEDDICTSSYFLEYMNRAFDLYQNVPQVMHVAGFTNLNLYPVDCSGEQAVPFYFTPHMSGWGWGTWRDRWQRHFVHYRTRAEALDGLTEDDQNAIQYGGVFPCLKSLDKDPIPWDICWEIAIYKAKGLCLTPGRTLVRNIGLRNGTHFRSFDILQHYEFDREPWKESLPITYEENPRLDPRIEKLFAEAITDWGIRYTPLGKLVRSIYKKFKSHKSA